MVERALKHQPPAVPLVLFDEVRWAEDEHLAHQIRVLLGSRS
jgi:hypothetical protein